MGNIDHKRSLMGTDIVKLCVSKIRYVAAQIGSPRLLVLNTASKVMEPFAGGPSTGLWLQAPDIWVTSILAQIRSYFRPSFRQETRFAISSASDLGGAPGTSSDKDIEHVACEVLDLLTRYGRHDTASSDSEVGDWPARAIFSDRVKQQVCRNTPIQMVIPAFPWKSVSKAKLKNRVSDADSKKINQVDKVIGCLPDLGEVLALARLNQLCRDIESVYPRGGEIIIASDGLVFDGEYPTPHVVGISEEHTWEYSEALAKIIEEKGFDRLKLRRVMDVIGFTDQQPMTKQTYLSLTNQSRTILMQKYGRTEDDIRALIATDHDTLMTYRGFIRFLENDLRYSAIASKACSGSQYRKSVKLVAKAMMIRAESFTRLIQDRYSDHVRLSIHPSSGAAKLSVPLIEQPSREFPKTPWHCAIAMDLHGSYRTVHAREVRQTHNLICIDGRPHYYRQRSALWDWDDSSTDSVVFEPQYPKGLLVYPAQDSKAGQCLASDRVRKLKSLAEVFEGPIQVSRFANAIEVNEELEQVAIR